MLLYVGLALIVLAWCFQFTSKGKDLKAQTLLIYCLGTAVLAANGLLNGISVGGVLELLSFVSAFAVLIKVSRK